MTISTNNNSTISHQSNDTVAAPVVAFMKRASYTTATTSSTAENGNESSVKKRLSTRKSVLADRREFLKQQAALDKQVFDSSLGCPLASFDHATLALVGGKALQCWKLAQHGFPVPTSFVVPTYVFSLHVGQAGVADMIQQLFTRMAAAGDWRDDPAVKEAAVDTLTTIRTKILETPLHPTVVENLKVFLETYLDPGTPVAVRSSSSAEDLSNQSFAGQYETHLYQTSLDDICHSIKKCWVSMYQPCILDYESRTGGVAAIKPPQMGVLIMKMVDATSAGVCFTRNLWGADNEVMVEAVLGQGEGLVSGRYVC
jgi:phosphoenolpyruvate synthase/pyruvate phosphate dikinase